MQNSIKINANEILSNALEKHKIRLELLVAETSIWAHPDEHHRLLAKGHAARYPHVRRAKPGQKERTQTTSNIRLDNNTYANNTIKRAIGINRKHLEDFECCHIWEKTCYDERYHTAIANLVLLPRALAGLTDHMEHIRKILQYRSYELYGWHPIEQKIPQKPRNYPESWRPHEPPQKTVRKDRTRTIKNMGDKTHPMENDPAQKIELWASNPKTNVHKIIALVLKNEGIKRSILEKSIAELNISKNPYGAVSSLASSTGNSYGHVFDISSSGTITIRKSLAPIIHKFIWRI